MKNPFSRAVMRRAARWSALALGATVVGLTAEACNVDRMLTVQDIDVTTPEGSNGVSGLPVLYAGGISEFMVALTNTDAAITMPGLLSDELQDIDTFPTRIEVDQRNIQLTNATVQGWYRQMHRARAALARGTAAYEQFQPTNGNKAELHALEGFMYIMFAEDFCNGVAYSDFNASGPVYGAANSGTASLKLAIAQFDSALTQATSGSNHYLAEVGKARAQLDLKQYAAAATTVADVPLGFNYYIRNSTNTSTENSGVYINVGPPSKRFGVANGDGGNGLLFRAEGYDSASKAGDGRVKWYKAKGTGQDGVSPAYYQLKYPDYQANVPLATGIEAQLIRAEALINAGNGQAALDTLNSLRANVKDAQYTPVPAANLTLQGTQAAQIDQLFRERAFWLYLTGHRLGDLRRLVWQYGRPQTAVFPNGNYTGAAGGTYGTDVNFPITVDENNNTQAPTCTDRNADFGQ